MGRAPEKKEIANPISRHSAENDLEREIEAQIGPLINKNQREQIVARVVKITQSEQFRGPIAHPKHFREYEDILPGSADRILRMAEKNLSHAHQVQIEMLRAEITENKSGRTFGFAALVILIIAALVSGYMGLMALSLAFLGAGVLGVVGSLIKGRNGNSEADDD